MKVLLDLNVVLDLLLNRSPWVNDAKVIWNANSTGIIRGYLAATELTNLFYIVRRLAGEQAARIAVGECLSAFEIALVDRQVLEDAHQQTGVDFEDNVLMACALLDGMDWIVTRDPSGFARSHTPVLSPSDLVARLS